jgi:hypothetical protein
MWQGNGVIADGGQDPEAVRVVSEAMSAEQWRITRVLDDSYQRERVGLAGGQPVADALYVVRETPDECVVEIRDRRVRTLDFHVRSDDRVEVKPSDAWYSLVLQKRR